MPVVEIEVHSDTNANLRWEPVGETLRGSFRVSKCRNPEAGRLAMHLPDGLPGMRVRIDPEKGTAAILEPLAGPDHKTTRDTLAKLTTGDETATGERLTFAPALKEYPAAHAPTWIGWAVRAVRAGLARVVSGKLPDKVPADCKPRSFSPPEPPDEKDATIKALVAVLAAKLTPDERKQFAGLLGQ